MRDVKSKYLSMGRWKKRALMKLNRGSRTRSSMGRTYVAIPPEQGWPGGSEEKNGLGGRAK